MKKVNIFFSLISESKTHILYRFITHSEIFQAFISWFWWLWLTDNENPKFSVSENIDSLWGSCQASLLANQAQ